MAVFSISFDAVAVSAAQDLFELNAPADAIVVVHSLHVGQSSDYGDAEAEGLRLSINTTTNGVAGSGGTTETPQKHQTGSEAAGGVYEANNTTRSTVQTSVQSYAFNAQAGFYYQPTPEERITISPSGALIIGLEAAPSDAVTMSGYVTFEEIGG